MSMIKWFESKFKKRQQSNDSPTILTHPCPEALESSIKHLETTIPKRLNYLALSLGNAKIERQTYVRIGRVLEDLRGRITRAPELLPDWLAYFAELDYVNYTITKLNVVVRAHKLAKKQK